MRLLRDHLFVLIPPTGSRPQLNLIFDAP